jgi:RNA polymerase sigma factor (sigma-70 family)
MPLPLLMDKLSGIPKGAESMAVNDMELVQSSLTGDTYAFEQIVTRYQSLICAITYNGTGEFSSSRDLAQETFLQAWKNLNQLRDAAKLKSWLCGIASNLLKNHYRQLRTEALRPAEDFSSSQESDTPLDSVIRQEEETIVTNALQELPEHYRETLLLYYWEQNSLAEVAEKLELSQDAVRQRLSRGRQLLKVEVSKIVEDVLHRSRPSRTFTIAVLAALPAIAPQVGAAAIGMSAAKGSTAGKAALGMSLSGAVWGPLLGFLGAAFGVRASLKAARSPRERKFIIRLTWLTIAYVIGFHCVLLLVMYLFRTPLMRWYENSFMTALNTTIVVLAGSYSVGLIALIWWGNKRIKRIQQEEGTYVSPSPHNAGFTKNQIRSSFGGSIIGCVCWIVLYAAISNDYVSALVTAALAVLVFIISTKYTVRHPEKYYLVSCYVVISMGIYTLGILLLRWEDWTPVYARKIPPSSGDISSQFSLWGIVGFVLILYVCLSVCMYSLYKRHRKDHLKNPHPE